MEWSVLFEELMQLKKCPRSSRETAFPDIICSMVFMPYVENDSDSADLFIREPILSMKLIMRWKPPRISTIFTDMQFYISVALSQSGWSNVSTGVLIFNYFAWSIKKLQTCLYACWVCGAKINVWQKCYCRFSSICDTWNKNISHKTGPIRPFVLPEEDSDIPHVLNSWILYDYYFRFWIFELLKLQFI